MTQTGARLFDKAKNLCMNSHSLLPLLLSQVPYRNSSRRESKRIFLIRLPHANEKGTSLSNPVMRVIIILYWIKYQYLSMKYTYPYLAKFDHIRTILFQVFISFESLAEVWLISLITNI